MKIYTLIPAIMLLTGFNLMSQRQTILNQAELKSTSANILVHNDEALKYDVIYHRAEWEVNPELAEIKGAVTTYFKAVDASGLNSVSFDLSDALTVDSVKYQSQKKDFVHSGEKLKISLDVTVPQATLDSVSVYYHGTPENNGYGSFAKHPDLPRLHTLSSPYWSKDWWPCKMSLHDKVDSLDIHITTPEKYTGIGNGRLVSETITNGKKTSVWKHRYPVSYYLIAIAVAEYENFTQSIELPDGSNMDITNYLYPQDINSYRSTVAHAADVMTYFNDLFGVYPFYKEGYRQVQISWQGGMENQTVSHIGGYLQYFLMEHELAHQWFGNYVGTSSWSHVALKEGLAVFCEYLTYAKYRPQEYPEWKQLEVESVSWFDTYGSLYVEDTTNTQRMYDTYLTYNKGGAFMNLLRNQLGEEVFFDGLRSFLDKNAFGVASIEDLRDELEHSSGKELDTFFDNWYYKEGFPEYTINVTHQDNSDITFTINQTTSHESVDFFALNLPILFKGASGESKLGHFHNTTDGEEFTFNAGFEVSEIVLDPDFDIITSHPATVMMASGATNVNEQNVVELCVPRIAPNPVKDICNITTCENQIIKRVHVYDMSGHKLLVQTFDTSQAKLNLSHLAPGKYLVTMMIDGEVHNKLIIKD